MTRTLTTLAAAALMSLLAACDNNKQTDDQAALGAVSTSSSCCSTTDTCCSETASPGAVGESSDCASSCSTTTEAQCPMSGSSTAPRCRQRIQWLRIQLFQHRQDDARFLDDCSRRCERIRSLQLLQQQVQLPDEQVIRAGAALRPESARFTSQKMAQPDRPCRPLHGRSSL